MKRIWLLIFIIFPSIVLGHVRINKLPVQIKKKEDVLYVIKDDRLKVQEEILAFNIFTKIKNFFTRLFYKKSEFNITIPIPPPPPPPGYNIKQKKVNPKKDINFYSGKSSGRKNVK